MDINTILDAIKADIDTNFSEFATVEIHDNIPQSQFALPAFFIGYGDVAEADKRVHGETHLRTQFRALVVYKESQRATLDAKLSAYIKHINDSQWGLAVTPAELEIPASALVEFDPPQIDKYVRQITFTHNFQA